MALEPVLRLGAKTPWSLNPRAFSRLLDRLGTNPGESAAAYERLRQRLTGLLRWWGAAQPEELADQTLDRLARKLEEGAVVPDISLGAFARGVARMVFMESRRQPSPVDEPLGEVAAATDEPNVRLDCLDRCLAGLPDADRGLVLRYYGDGRAKEVRQRLAGELRISPTALRIRAHRVREKLERCTTACLEAGA